MLRPFLFGPQEIRMQMHNCVYFNRTRFIEIGFGKPNSEGTKLLFYDALRPKRYTVSSDSEHKPKLTS